MDELKFCVAILSTSILAGIGFTLGQVVMRFVMRVPQGYHITIQPADGVDFKAKS